jgi:nucleotide-binding universal stress UspA family protein
MPIKTILVPTDFSDNAHVAFEKAFDLAGQLGAKLHLLHVQNESTLRMAIKEGLLRDDSTDEELQVEIGRLIEERCSRVLAGCETPGGPIEHLSRRGEPEVVIVRYAREINADLVVVGLRGAGLSALIKSAVMGSIAESVVRKSPCPVLVVRLDHK